MRGHAGAARWIRLTLAALLVLLVSLDVDAIAADRGIAVLASDDGPDQPDAGWVTSGVDLVAPRPSSEPAPATGDQRSGVGAIAISPTDRAPPRA